jgi:type IV pilus assembly protein PilB
MPLTNAQLKILLVGSNLLEADQFASAEIQAKNAGKSIESVIIAKELISENNLGQLKANFFRTPFAILSQVKIEEEVLNIVPEVVARKQQIISFKKDDKGIHLAMGCPNHDQIVEFIGKKTGLPVVRYQTTQSELDQALSLYSQDVEAAFTDVIESNVKQAKGSSKAEPPIIKLVETILDYAHQNKASDVHIEPLENKSLVRFRIDGVLHDVVALPLELHPRIVTRIKVLAKLRTDEHQSSQDGKLQYKTQLANKEDLDIRVSLVPITEGEKVVMRLLSERSRQMSLDDLGLQKKDLAKVRSAYQKPHGMILSTGPTGSGKTTSLYVILQVLNQAKVNIMTIEDPVEYDIERVNQIQVNEKTELTFAKGLRSIVRQDPDIILVGEVRDEDTAGIAINSAMTGHLVLSTLHTNNAATAVPRLMDLGVEPFLIASSVNVIIAQRLVRKICQKCRESYDATPDQVEVHLTKETTQKFFEDKKSQTVYQGKGCEVCHHTGYVGRIGVFEVLVLDDDIRQAITTKSDASEIQALAVKAGMTSMLEDGLEKIKQGLTTFEEVIRVTKE